MEMTYADKVDPAPDPVNAKPVGKASDVQYSEEEYLNTSNL